MTKAKRRQEKVKKRTSVARPLNWGLVAERSRLPAFDAGQLAKILGLDDSHPKTFGNTGRSDLHIHIRFRSPSRTTLLELSDFFGVIGSLCGEVARLESWNERGPRPGAYVSGLAMNSPGWVNLTLIKLKGEWAEAIVELLKLLVNRKVNRKRQEAEVRQIEARTILDALESPYLSDEARARLADRLVEVIGSGQRLKVRITEVRIYQRLKR